MALSLPTAVEVAVLVLAVSAGAPLLPRKLMKIGHESYMLSLVATSSIVAVVAVPLWLQVLGPVYGLSLELAPREVAAAIAKAFVLPLLLGMLFRWRFPQIGAKLSGDILAAAGIALAVGALGLLLLHGRLLLDVGWPSLFALPLFTALALLIGHVLGGPDPKDRTALAIACATRHIGIAILVAASLPGTRIVVLLTAYLLSTAIVSALYLRWVPRSVVSP